MKKRYAFLLSIVLLTGCSGEALTPQDSISQSTTASATTVPTASEAVTDGAQKPTPPETEDTSSGVDLYSPEKEDVIYPTYKEIECQIKYEADEDDITAQIGYDTPVDVTKLEEYEWALECAQELDEEERQELISANYTHLNYNCHFIGSEKADWLYFVSYELSVGGPVYDGYYSKMFYVKDGKVTEMLAEFEGGAAFSYKIYGDEIFFPANNGIYSFDLNTDELKRLCDADNVSYIVKVTDDFILFHSISGFMNVYYFDSGDVFETVIYCSPAGEGGAYSICDDIIVFENYNMTDQYPDAECIALDLKTCEYAPYYDEVEQWYYDTGDEKRYTISDEGLNLMITDNTDNSVKVYSLLKPWLKLCPDKKYNSIYWASVEGNMAYGYLRGDAYIFFALDLVKNEVYTIISPYNGFNYDIYDGSVAFKYSGSCAVYYPLV